MISLSIANNVAEVVLDAPHKLNSLDEQALSDLSQAYDDAAAVAMRGRRGRCCLGERAAPSVRAVIFRT